MSRWLRVTIVMAAAAFVVAFRFSADGNDADAGPVTTARAAAAVEAPTPAKPSAGVRLAPVVELPALASEPAARVAAREKQEAAARKARAAKKQAEAARKKRAIARRKKTATARKKAAAAARRRAATTSTPRVVVTPARPRTPVYTPPAPTKKSSGGYVGKDFDSEG